MTSTNRMLLNGGMASRVNEIHRSKMFVHRGDHDNCIHAARRSRYWAYLKEEDAIKTTYNDDNNNNNNNNINDNASTDTAR